MPELKYSKNVTRDIVKAVPKKEGAYVNSTRHLKDWGGGDISTDSIFVTQPHVMITQPHQHEFPQYLHFFSANAADPTEFDAEIHITLGEEGEVHVIDSPAAVHIPAGTLHGPLEFVRIDKPVLFVDVAVTGSYSRIGNTPD